MISSSKHTIWGKLMIRCKLMVETNIIRIQRFHTITAIGPLYQGQDLHIAILFSKTHWIKETWWTWQRVWRCKSNKGLSVVQALYRSHLNLQELCKDVLASPRYCTLQDLNLTSRIKMSSITCPNITNLPLRLLDSMKIMATIITLQQSFYLTW